MPSPKKPFRFNVGFIIHEEVGYNHDFPFEFEKLKLEDLELYNFEGIANVGKTPPNYTPLINALKPKMGCSFLMMLN